MLYQEPKQPEDDEALVQDVDQKQATPSAEEICRFTRSMARGSETGTDVTNKQERLTRVGGNMAVPNHGQLLTPPLYFAFQTNINQFTIEIGHI